MADLSLCDDFYVEKYSQGVVPSLEGSVHEARLVGVGPWYAWIDEQLAELVCLCWRLGIVTTESCHDLFDNGQCAFIGFQSCDEVQDFLGAAFDPNERCESGYLPGVVPLDQCLQHDFGFVVKGCPRYDGASGRWDLLGDHDVFVEFHPALVGKIVEGLRGRYERVGNVGLFDDWYERNGG